MKYHWLWNSTYASRKKERIHRGIIELFFTVVFDKMKMPWMYYENKLKKWKRTSGHIVNLDLNTSTPFELPSRPLLLQRSIRIGGKKKPQDDKHEINIEVHIVLLLNEMKRNVKDDERNETLNWIRDYTISELLDHWNSGRKLNQYRPRAASFQTLSPVTWWFS